MVLLNFISFSRYAVESVIRNKRRSLYAIVGVAIAISLVSGSSISVDSSIYGMVRAAIDPIPVDFVGYCYGQSLGDEFDESDLEPTADRLESVEGVRKAVPVVSSDRWSYLNEVGDEFFPGTNPYDTWAYGNILFLPSDSEALLDGYKIDGELPASGTVAISRIVADTLNISVGEDITCSLKYESGGYVSNGTFIQNMSYENLTLEVGAVWSHTGEVDLPYSYYSYWADWVMGDVNVAELLNPIVMNMADAESLFMPSVGPLIDLGWNYLTLSYDVWIDRDEFIEVGNLQGTIDWLDYTAQRLTTVSNSQVTFYNLQLRSELANLEGTLFEDRVLFIGLSAPVIALGTYLSIVGVELGSNERRREAGMLKARGASTGNVFGALMLEATALGAIAGAIGLSGGLLVSRFLLGSIMSGQDYDYRYSDLYISSSTVAIAILFAVFLMLASAYRPMRRTSRMEIAEALHFYTQSTTKIGYKMRYDIAALVLVALNIWVVLYWSDSFTSDSDSFFVSMVIVVVFIIGISTTPFTPFLLTVGLSRLLTRGPGGLYRRFTAVFRPWTKELHYLVEKNIARNPRRASNICVIVSLALAFGIVISVTMETSIAHSRAIAAYEVGSDIRIMGYPDQTTALDTSKMDAAADIEGVAEFCRFRLLETEVNYQYINFAAIDPGGYIAAADPAPSYFTDGTGVIEDLETQGTFVANEDLANRNAWVVGDSISMTFSISYYYDDYSVEAETIALTLVGLVKESLPGLVSSRAFTSLATLEPLGEEFGGRYGCLVKVAGGYDHTSVAASVRSAFWDAGVDAEYLTLEDWEREVTNSSEMRALADFLYVEYSLAFVIMTAGIGLVVFVTVSDREREVACIMARGSSGGQMRRILMGESMSLMVLGLIIGLSVGLGSAYLFNLLLVGTTASPVPHGMVFSLPSIAIVLASVGAFVLASYLATARAGRVRLAEVLRIRGG